MRGAGVATEDFSVTATFANPTEQTETPWDVGVGFHQNPGQSAIREIGVSSDGGLVLPVIRRPERSGLDR